MLDLGCPTQVEITEAEVVPSWHRLVLPASRDGGGAEGACEDESLIWLADRLLASSDAAVRASAAQLYVTVSR